jgi:hypothetical protein
MPNNEIHQHPDGHVYVRTDRGTYADAAANFALDSGKTLPTMPAGADDHIYTQGKRHCFMGDGNVIAGGPMPWPEGDAIIASISVLLTTQAKRIAAAKLLSEPSALKA